MDILIGNHLTRCQHNAMNVQFNLNGRVREREKMGVQRVQGEHSNWKRSVGSLNEQRDMKTENRNLKTCKDVQ
jgi:hypothetical protein